MSALANVGVILQTRHLRTGHGADLDGAVDAVRAGVHGTRPDGTETSGRLANLGNVLRLRGVRTRSKGDIDEAVRTLKAAAQLARSNRAGHLSNLGAALQSRAEVGDGDPAAAPPVLREAVALTPDGWRHRPLYLSNLGNPLVSVGEPGQAVGLQHEALGLPPDGHPDRAVVLGNLAPALAATGDDAVLPRCDARRSGRDRRPHRQQPGPSPRLLAAWRLADLRAAGGDPTEVGPAMRVAVELAECAAWLGVTPTDRAYTRVWFSSFAMDAAAGAVAQRDPAAAVAALEAGRGVGWREQLDQRRVDALADHNRGLADRLRAIGVALARSVA